MSANALRAAAPEHSAIVKASAGVGKTYLLVTRLVRLLLAGARPDTILAITFTRKAAAEMQERLAARLFEFVQCEDIDLRQRLQDIGIEPDADTLERARNLYEVILRSESAVRTTTFHAFCQEILRRFPLEADVPPAFDLVERTGALEAEAWEALYAEATLAPDSELGQMLERLYDECDGLSNTREALKSFMQHRSDWWAFTLGKDDPVGQAMTKLTDALEIDPDARPVEAFLEKNRDMLTGFARLLGRHTAATTLKQADALAMFLATAHDTPASFEEIQKVFFKTDGEPRDFKVSKAYAKTLEAEGIDENAFQEKARRLCNAVLSCQDALNRQFTYRICEAWYVAGQRLLDHYQRLKQEQRVLDFADLEWKAFLLLNHSDNALWVQYKLDQRINHMLIDEFQDTNPTQWNLLLPLMEELAASSEQTRSMFIVGDDKQSIYGFRRADPRLLHVASDWLGEYAQARQYPMDKSRRSASAIMDLVNAVFPHSPIQSFAPHDTHHGELYGEVAILPLIEPVENETVVTEGLRNPLLEPRIVETDTRHYREGQQIAAKIHAMVNEQTLIGEGGKVRPVEYGDFMILIRTRQPAQAYEQALREAHVPYIAAGRGGFLDAEEIRDMVALLDVLSTPFNNISLATVLRSPLFDCRNEDLIAIAQCDDGKNWFDKLQSLVNSGRASATLQHALSCLTRWRQLGTFRPIHDLLDRIYTESNVYACYEAAFPLHLRRRVKQNLMRFINLALEVDSGRYPSIGRFLAQLESIKSFDSDSLDAVAENASNAVRIMTIHASKGLEAPVVFLADTTSTRRKDKGFRTLLDWPVDQKWPRHFLLAGKKETMDGFSRQLVEAQNQKDEIEDANLLYVAITRARQYLFVSGCRPKKNNKEETWYDMIVSNWPAAEGQCHNSGVKPQMATMQTPAPPLSIVPDPELCKPLAPKSSSDAALTPSRTSGHAQTGEDEDAQEQGVVIHHLFEWLTENPDMTFESLTGRLNQKNHFPEHDVLVNYLTEVKQVLSSPELARFFDPAFYENARNELSVQFMHSNGNWINGTIDRVVITPDEVHILDYKTHRIESISQIDALADRYAGQMRLYAEGARLLWPDKTVRAHLIFTRPAISHEVEIVGTRLN